MHESTLAKRYANALADLATQQELLARVGEELGRFQELMDATPGLRQLMMSPTAAIADQQKALGVFLEQAACAPLTGNFLRLLVDKRRMPLFAAVLVAYIREMERLSGRLRVHVTTPMSLTQTHMNRLTATLSELTSKEVSIDVEEEPQLLGGMVVRIGSVMMDYSVRNRLNRLKAHLKG